MFASFFGWVWRLKRVLSWAKHKQNQQLNKKSGKKSSKLVSVKSHHCPGIHAFCLVFERTNTFLTHRKNGPFERGITGPRNKWVQVLLYMERFALAGRSRAYKNRNRVLFCSRQNVFFCSAVDSFSRKACGVLAVPPAPTRQRTEDRVENGSVRQERNLVGLACAACLSLQSAGFVSR